MNAKEYAEHIGVSHGTVKRWRGEGLPGVRGPHHTLVIDPVVADAWVAEHHPKSCAFNRASCIYFARREDGAVKIGWSSDVMRRMAELRKATGRNVVFLAAYPGAKPDELALHARFAAFLIEGEWFTANPELDAFLAALKGAGSVVQARESEAHLKTGTGGT